MSLSPEILHAVVVGMVVALVIVVVLVSAWGGVHLVAKTFELTRAVVRMVLVEK